MRNKKDIIYFLFVIAGVVLLVNLQSFVVRAEANVDPISVSTNELGFGMVFPGETLEKEFIVSLFTGEGGLDFVKYQITQTPGYLDLCPFLKKVSEEGEGDTESHATLDANSVPQDLSDTWKVVLDVPAIEGFVAQEHTFGVVSEGGEYGCDIGVEIIE